MKIINPLTRVALWTFVLGTLFLSHSPSAAAVTETELFFYWNDRYVTAFDTIKPARPYQRTLSLDMLAKAKPDECFFDIGDTANSYDIADPDINTDECYGLTGKGDGIYGPPANPGTPKVNQSDVGGLAKSGDNLWFGTGPNNHCLMLSTYYQHPDFIEYFPGPFIQGDGSYTCEFGESQFAPPDSFGDRRPPRIFVYDTQNETLTEKTNDVLLDQSLLVATLAIRSAGTLEGIVILGGPGFETGGDEPSLVNLFAFKAQTGEYIGSTSLTGYTNIRKWLAVDGVLYAAVGNASGGAVLRWVGTPAAPFSGGTTGFGFDVVGTLDASGSDLALHNGRLFASTWSKEKPIAKVEAGIFMSPEILAGGLTTANANQWIKVWKITDYEPDSVTAMAYGGGALASFDGYLYWGTMNVPLLSTIAHFDEYGELIDTGNYPETEDIESKAFLATHRPISIFRGRDFDGTKEIELLYGLDKMYVFDSTPAAAPAATPAVAGQAIMPVGWDLVANNMGAKPLYGQSGFGNFYNHYTLSMSVYNGKLYVGTMDFAILFADLIGDDPQFDAVAPRSDLGADLMHFDSSATAAAGDNFNGAGNYSSYGVRTMVSDVDALYLGMTNPMNLRANPADAPGGWELIKAIPGSDPVAAGESGGGCFVSVAGFKDRLHTSPIFAILFSLGVISVLCVLGMAIQRRRTNS